MEQFYSLGIQLPATVADIPEAKRAILKRKVVFLIFLLSLNMQQFAVQLRGRNIELSEQLDCGLQIDRARCLNFTIGAIMKGIRC